jgi:hypothetical protein
MCNTFENEFITYLSPTPPPLLFSPSDSPVPLPIQNLLLLETISEWALESLVHKITNVPVFLFMGMDVWIWMGVNPFLGPFEGVDPENLDF